MRGWLGRREDLLHRLFFLELVALTVLLARQSSRTFHRGEQDSARQELERARQAGNDQAMADYAGAQYAVMRSTADAARSLVRVTEDMSAETTRAQRLALKVGVGTAVVGVLLGAFVSPLAARWIGPHDAVSYVVCVSSSGEVLGFVPHGDACADGSQTSP